MDDDARLILRDDAPPLPAGLPTDKIVWDLRGIWARAQPCRLMLSERCVVRMVMGPLTRISVTGAFCVVDGWHIPCEDILAVTIPTRVQLDEYRQEAAERALERGEDHL